jgi:hypothetical protein
MGTQIRALEQIRRMRGGAQAHLLRCSDKHYYVAKCPNNPQGGVRILINELLGSRLAALLNLPVAVSQTVLVEEFLIRYTAEMVMENPRDRTPCQAGLWFGSRYPVNPCRGVVCDMLLASEGTNRQDFIGMLVFDKWTCNTDGRQAVFFRPRREEQLLALMIDQGFCFNSTEWSFPDAPRRGRYRREGTYDCVTGIDAFEPWLSHLESGIDVDALLAAAKDIPPEWLVGETESFLKLLETLDRRRKLVRGLLYSMRNACRDLFPNWVEKADLHISPAIGTDKGTAAPGFA